ncbi:aminopeptidase N [Actinomyces capricornis]|uniref:Aminopeptidase N n=1 Tax=Actinomyces capricornis TaxID=2755559 RepID=A0ABM7UET3_9ACTO|nr:aminopeptidase N [Actinomyces capricornis]BDA65684.1 aminopeptidase [Actinomyces capricornis]
MTCPPPPRPDSPTSLSRQEALWRSEHVAVVRMSVEIDLTSAPDRQATGFAVSTELVLRAPGAVEGLWVDFLGEEVHCLEVDGQAAEPQWDGVRIALPALEAGEHLVRVRARGRYSNSGQGLHRFHDPLDGATYLYTHFEPSDARRAWPCMDQPDLKAVFRLSLTYPRDWTVLSNGRPETASPATGSDGGRSDGAARTLMTPTRPLPPYLTALAAGPWHRVEGRWHSSEHPGLSVPLSWSCRASLARHLDAQELMDLTARGLDFYDRVYGQAAYPWGSYDSVLVPEYNLGAMENPGCVTFNEEAYLFQGPVTRAQRGARANTILHEMCHMWFGDLVTPRWWEDTWLKESFADHQGTWAQEQAAGHEEAWASFASSRKAWAYLEDSRPATTHPIVAQVEDVEAARQAFDGITYAKGASVLKQLVAHLGQEVFLAAANAWFSEHAFANASLADFLRTLSAASGRDMEAWARAWLHTAGPSILSNEILVQEGRIASLTLTQEGSDPTTGQAVVRPHTLVVGLYAERGGELVRTHRLQVELDGPMAVVDQAVGLPAPDMVLVNDEDLTYAVVRPDSGSLECALGGLARLKDPMARSLWWSMLHNLVRDARLEPQRFIQAVLTQADDETGDTTLATILAQALQAAMRYTDPARRPECLEPLLGDQAWGLLLASEPGSGAQLVRARAWLEAAGQGRAAGEGSSRRASSRIRQLLEGGVPGLVLDDDLRWRGLIALARLGAVTSQELQDQLRRDPGARGLSRHLQASSSAPSAQAKEDLVTRLLQDACLGNEEADALIAAFDVDAHHDLRAAWTPAYLESLEDLWAERSQEMATRLVRGLFPACGSQEEARAVRAWLDARPGAPAALRRLVLACADDLDRALRARAHR